jgi:hypothetical protein
MDVSFLSKHGHYEIDLLKENFKPAGRKTATG